MGYELGQRQGASVAQEARLSDAEMLASRRAGELAQLSADARRKLETMTRRLAELQARMTRLDALGTHLTALAGLEGGEFNFAVTEGYYIENGKIQYPVKAATLISTGPAVLKEISMVGKDFSLACGMCGSVSGAVPTSVGQATLKVDEILVGGQA